MYQETVSGTPYGSGDVIKTPNRSDPNQTVNAFVYCLDKSA